MTTRRFTISVIAVAVAVVVVSAGFASTSGDRGPGSSARLSRTDVPHGWYDALTARSEALNRTYGLGDHARTASTGEPAWLKALRARSEGLNRTYGLDNHARTASAGEPAWLKALRARSEGLNRKYDLGDETPSSR